MNNDILAIAVLPFNTPHNIQPSAVLGKAIPISPCKHPANNGGINMTNKEYADILLPLTVKYIGDKAFNYCNIFVNTSKDNPLWNSESCFKEDIRIYYKDEWRINQSGQLIVTTKNE